MSDSLNTNKSASQKLSLIQSIQARPGQIIEMKASGDFVGWNLSSIKSPVSNYQTATVGGREGMEGMEGHTFCIFILRPSTSTSTSIYITAFPSDRQA